MEPEEESVEYVEFWVVRVPEAVFSTDTQDSLRVSNDSFLRLRTNPSPGVNII